MLKGTTLSKVTRCALVSSSALYMFCGTGVALAQESGASSDDGIVVTGSRIVRRDYDSDSPIVTVGEELLEASGSVNVDEQLKELPQFTGGAGGITSANDVQALPTSSPGIATVDLRGLGANRTLVLLDGRRMQPANASLVVDLNTIPRSAIEGVEVITGGAASTYGADAVAGVVNFQLKKNFSGVDIDAQYGIGENGDGQTIDISALVGSDFADGRGNAMLGLNFSDRRVVRRSDIEFYRNAWRDSAKASQSSFISYPGYDLVPDSNGNVTFNYGAQGRPSQAAVDAVFGQYGVAPGDVVAGVDEIFFNRGATLADFSLFSRVPGSVTGSSAPNFQGNLYPNNYLQTDGTLSPNTGNESFAQIPIRRYSMFGHSYYDITDDITFYVQGLFSSSEVTTQSAPSVSVLQWSVGVPFDAATCGAAVQHEVPDDLCTLLASRSNPDAPWALRQSTDFVGSQRLQTDITTYEVMAGLRGNLPMLGDWTYDLFASHGSTNQNNTYENFAVLAQYQSLISAPNYGANSKFFFPRTGLDATCTSGLNPFIVQEVSQDCKDIVSPDLHTLSKFTQDQVELNLQGRLLDLPAGEVRAAVGGAYRANDFNYSPDQAFRSDNLNSLVVGVFSVLPASGSTNVKEVYGEVLVPVLADLPAIQELTINAGIRYSDYSTEGGVTTWKATADWQVVDWLKIRGGYQYANRAPNIAELFQPGTYSTVTWSVSDPCANTTIADYGNIASNPDRQQVIGLCDAMAGGDGKITENFRGNLGFFFPLGRDFTVGNPDVNSEVVKSWTLGGVLRAPSLAPALRNLTLSVDYYNIRVDGAIQAASTEFVYEQCLNADGASNPSYDPDNAFCQLIIRDADPNSPTQGNWLSTRAQFTNLGQIATSGIDASLDWSIPAPGFGGEQGAVFLNASFNWLEKFDVQAVPGGAFTQYKGVNTNNEAFIGAQFDWRLNTTVGYDFGLGSLALNWRHRPSIDSTAAGSLPIESYNIFDLSGRVRASEMIEFRAGIENLFDTDPPFVGVIPGVTSASDTTDLASYDILGRRFYFGAKLRF